MKRILLGRWIVAFLVTFALLPGLANAGQAAFGRLVVFGTSLTDPGNAFALKGGVNTPPYDDPQKMDATLIPDVPYARGGHHFTNGATWIEQFSRPIGLAWNTMPAYAAADTEATNYAVGGARAYEDGVHVNMSDQVTKFLTLFSSAPSDALYVIEFGGNDIRDALATGNPAILSQALTAIGNNVALLYQKGARKFLIWNAPNPGLTPAIRTLDAVYPGVAFYAGLLTSAFNTNLDALLGSLSALPGIEIKKFNAEQTLDDLVQSPASFGLTVVDAACIEPGVPPFECRDQDEYLFWDGIHPTKAVHGIIAQDVADVLAQP